MKARFVAALLATACLVACPLLLACEGYQAELSITNTTPFDLNVQFQQSTGATIDWFVLANDTASVDGFDSNEDGIADVMWQATTGDITACDPPVARCFVDSGTVVWQPEAETAFIQVDLIAGN